MLDQLIYMTPSLDHFWALAETKFSASGGFAGRAFDNLTTVHPIGLIFLIVSCIAILSTRRGFAVVPFIFMACFVSSAQRIVVAGVDFDFTRIIVLVGCLRIVLYQEWKDVRLNTLDWLVIAWSISKLVCYSLLWMDPARTQFMLGQLLDTTGSYFVFRALVRNLDDLRTMASAFALLAIPVAVFFLLEFSTGRNVFSIFGGVPEMTVMRQGKLRCQGAFSHPIVAGCFWAAVIPMFLGLLRSNPPRLVLACVGTLSSLVIIITCSSSTPVFGVIVGLIGLSFWFFRLTVKPVLWGTAASLVVLHFVMEGPVWHLISRVSAVGGSTGYHRYSLIDQAIRRFSEWGLVGTRSTVHWGHFLFDVANHYILQGVQGGILTLLLFVSILVVAFRSISRILAVTDHNSESSFVIWCLGVSLMVHCANFIGISYFGQATMLLSLHLGSIGSMLSTYVLVAKAEGLPDIEDYSLEEVHEVVEALP